MEIFIKQYPDSEWVPSLRSLIAKYYRETGRYSRALEHWELSWEETKGAKSGSAKQVADFTFAHWTRLLASLGRRSKLNDLFTETESRSFDRGPLQQIINGTKEGYSVMTVRPGSSYKCGTYALWHVGEKLLGTNFDSQALLNIPSPETGFRMSDLVALAQRFKLGLTPERLPKDAALVVPSVVHWRENHFAAIVDHRDDVYQVVDPTFETTVWMKRDVIVEESSGYFLVPAKYAHNGLEVPKRHELEHVFGKGQPNSMNDAKAFTTGAQGQRNGPGHDKPCPPSGMAAWSISEPFISLWLQDEPLGYQPSKGPRVSFLLSYDQRDSRDSTYSFGLGASWECSWLAYVDFTSGAKTLYAPGGGQLEYRSNTGGGQFCGLDAALNPVTDTNNAIIYVQQDFADGRRCIYGKLWTNLVGRGLAFLTQEIDRFGNTNRLEYDTVTNTVFLRRVIDADGVTNTVSYSSTFQRQISQVVDGYGRTNTLSYDSTGLLTNITDVAGISSAFSYDSTGVITNLHTPYGDTGFVFTQQSVTNGKVYIPIRSAQITRPSGSTELYVYRDSIPDTQMLDSYSASEFPTNAPLFTQDNNHYMTNRNSFYWNARQYPFISAAGKTNFSSLTSNDFKYAHLKHWCHDHSSQGFGDFGDVSDVLFMERLPSPDGIVDGQTIWYEYYTDFTFTYPILYVKGLKYDVNCVARKLPDGSTNFVFIRRNLFGNPTNVASSFSINGVVNARTNVYVYATNGVDLVEEYFYDSKTNLAIARYAYNSQHQVTSFTNAFGEVTSYTYNNAGQLTSISFPFGLTRTNIYGTSGPAWLTQTIDLEINSTNSFTYSNGLVYTHTDPRGLTETNTFDALQRLTKQEDPRGYTALTYSTLDLASVRDRLGNTNSMVYNSLRFKTKDTDTLGRNTTYARCSCGSLDAITNALTQVTLFNYDYQGNLTSATFPDTSVETRVYNSLGQLVRKQEATGAWTTNFYNNQGLLEVVSNSFGLVMQQGYDSRDRLTNSIDANGVTTAFVYDDLDRVLSKAVVGGGTNSFRYSVLGLIGTTNEPGNVTWIGYDAAGRKTSETNANNETVRFTNSPAGDLIALVDGRLQTTLWNYDQFGRVTNKVDAAGTVVFKYGYDATDRMTSRWTPAKLTNFYSYDAVGNLTNVDHTTNTDIRFVYDALNRLSSMVDASGSSAYTYTTFGALASEDGPWGSDTVTYSYNNQLLTGISLAQQSAPARTLSFGYDGAARLSTLAAAEGNYSFLYKLGTLPGQTTFPGGANITNAFDSLARLTNTLLQTSGGTALNVHSYSYDLGNERTGTTRFNGSYANYAYDSIGQLRSAYGFESNSTARANEKFWYSYDASHNLNVRSNNLFRQSFTNNNLNEVTSIGRAGTFTLDGFTTSPATNVTVNGSTATLYTNDSTFAKDSLSLSDGTNTFTAVGSDSYGRTDSNSVTTWLPALVSLTYDSNGNLVYDGLRAFDYDDDDQLIRITVTNAWKSEFTYDGKNRRRVRKEFSWNGIWQQTNEVHYVYIDNDVLQERDLNNAPSVTYTRYGSSLLARTDHTLQQTVFYHADGNGNITALMSPNQRVVARYEYDPFGYTLVASGPAADANLYRFSSQESHLQSGITLFQRRGYDLGLQRFINHDPIEEAGGPNLYAYVGNDPIDFIDPLGLWSLDALQAHDYYNTVSANGLTQGGIAGYSKFVGAQALEFLIDLSGASSVQESAEKSGAASADPCHQGRAVGYGILTAGTILISAIPGEGKAASLAAREVENLVAKEAAIIARNGTKITGFTEHGIDRVIGDTAERAGTKAQAILDALKNPQKVVSGVDSKGRPFQIFTGENARVVVNPQTGRVVSVNPLSRAGAH